MALKRPCGSGSLILWYTNENRPVHAGVAQCAAQVRVTGRLPDMRAYMHTGSITGLATDGGLERFRRPGGDDSTGVADVVISSAHADISCKGPDCTRAGDFVTGGVAAVDMASHALLRHRAGVSAADAVVRIQNGRLFVLNRFGANTVIELTASSMRVMPRYVFHHGSEPPGPFWEFLTVNVPAPPVNSVAP